MWNNEQNKTIYLTLTIRFESNQLTLYRDKFLLLRWRTIPIISFYCAATCNATKITENKTNRTLSYQTKGFTFEINLEYPRAHRKIINAFHYPRLPQFKQPRDPFKNAFKQTNKKELSERCLAVTRRMYNRIGTSFQVSNKRRRRNRDDEGNKLREKGKLDAIVCRRKTVPQKP